MSTWWQDAVVYQIYPRSFADSNNDGIGDIKGIIEKVSYLASLGIDAVWMSPFYPSELADGGYDVIDYRNIDPRIGTLDDFAELVRALHKEQIKVIIDIVPNHSSDKHEWFQEAINSPIGSPARDRYIFRDGKGENGELPPNSWPSHFGPTCWSRLPDGQWYLHLFAPEQPDFNWDNPEVRADFEKTLRFWSDLDVDGFRIDVAHGLAKDLSEPFPEITTFDLDTYPTDGSHPLFDRDEVHEIYEKWRSIFNEYTPAKFAVAESGAPVSRRYKYALPNNLGQAFSFELLKAKWSASAFFEVAETSLSIARDASSTTTWCLSNHDVIRHLTRFGLPQDIDLDAWLLSNGSMAPCDYELGRTRSRAAILFELALLGSTYLYQGEELALPEVEDLPADVLADPIWIRSVRTRKGRDGCRVPLPWSSTDKNVGFGEGTPHLPLPERFRPLAADVQQKDPSSMLHLYQHAMSARRAFLNALGGDESFVWQKVSHPDLVHFSRGEWNCITNFGNAPIDFATESITLSSGDSSTTFIPGNTTYWFKN